MASQNLFDLLDDDTEDPNLVIAAAEKQKLEKLKKVPGSTPAQTELAKPAKLPTKPAPPAQAVREARNESGRGGGRGVGRGRGFGGRGGFNRNSNDGDNTNAFSGGYRPSEEGDERKQTERRGGYGGPRGSFRGGGRRGGFNDGGSGEGERPRRTYDRHSGTGRGNEVKRDGSGRGNWGSPTDEVAPETEENVTENEKNVGTEKLSGDEDAGKENAATEAEEKEPETKEMTLEEYEKVLEEKRKALLALKTSEERKVDTKVFESMQQISSKKTNHEIFIKLGSEKDKRKDADKEEKVKKSVSINEFLKPAEGERYQGGRGRGRGRGSRGEFGGNTPSKVSAPKIEDPGHFPSLGGK